MTLERSQVKSEKETLQINMDFPIRKDRKKA